MSKHKKSKKSPSRSNNQRVRTVSQVAEAAENFLNEAERCSRSDPVMGFAAMSTAFACVIAIGESLVGQPRAKDHACINAFCRKMSSFDWLLTSQNNQSQQQIPAEILWNVRNALVHALSLPSNVVLVPTKESFADYSSKFEIGIVPNLFVQVVRKTVQEVISQQPAITFDPTRVHKPLQIDRSPVKVDTLPSSGSMPG